MPRDRPGDAWDVTACLTTIWEPKAGPVRAFAAAATATATAAGNVAAFPGTLATVPAAGTALGRPGNTYAGYQVGDPADVQGVILKAITPVGQTGQARQD